MVHVSKSSACRFLSQGHKFTLQLESVLNPDVFSLSCGTDSIRLSYVRHASSILKLIRYMYDLWPYEWSLNGEIMWLSRRSSCECGRSLGLSHQKIWRISTQAASAGTERVQFFLLSISRRLYNLRRHTAACPLPLPSSNNFHQAVYLGHQLPAHTTASNPLFSDQSGLKVQWWRLETCPGALISPTLPRCGHRPT